MLILLLGSIFITNLAKYYKNPFFQFTCAVIQIKIDSVNKFAKSITAIITERDFKSENVLHMGSVVNNLVTSIEVKPIRCATTLSHFEPTRNDYVATHFILLSSTVERSATSG